MQNLPQIQNANVESLSTCEDLEKDDEDRIVVEQFSISLFCIYICFFKFGILSQFIFKSLYMLSILFLLNNFTLNSL